MNLPSEVETSPNGRSPEPVELVETAPETEGEVERRWGHG